MDAEKLAQAFVDLADTLVEDFDVLELLQVLTDRCVDVLEVVAAGLLLADEDRQLRVTVASSESARLLDLFQLQNDEGPCLECYHTGEPVAIENLRGPQPRWPRFCAAAVEEGFGSVLALPMRLRGQVIGTLNLFGTAHSAPLERHVLPIAQAMADVATITIMQERLARSREMVAEQLQYALDSRVAIEQAKGVVAAGRGISMDEAFALLRNRARASRRLLVEVAEEAISAVTPTEARPPKMR